MCGFAGCWGAPPSVDIASAVQRMAGVLEHRGPDGEGRWVDVEARVGFGHRRLAIQDLTDAAAQPMVSGSGRYVLVYNGEIYNFRELRRELETRDVIGSPCRGHGDTEVALAAIERWGPVEATTRFVGMFAFAVWDRVERTLTLARDRVGEKPMYFGVQDGCLLFGSELKALEQFPRWRGEVDRGAVDLLLRYGCIGAPRTIYAGIWKLAPGTVRVFRAPTTSDCVQYWSAYDNVGEANGNGPFVASGREAVDRLEELLRRAVRDQPISSRGRFGRSRRRW